jgi:hypothetical protein
MTRQHLNTAPEVLNKNGGGGGATYTSLAPLSLQARTAPARGIMAKYANNFADQVYKVRGPYHTPSHLNPPRHNTTKLKNIPAPPTTNALE